MTFESKRLLKNMWLCCLFTNLSSGDCLYPHTAYTNVSCIVVNTVILLTQHGGDPSARDFRGRHALHMAATGGRTATLALLVSHITEQLKVKDEVLDGATASDSLQPLDEYGFTPLHFAAYRGHLECLKLLLNCACYNRLRVS